MAGIRAQGAGERKTREGPDAPMAKRTARGTGAAAAGIRREETEAAGGGGPSGYQPADMPLTTSPET